MRELYLVFMRLLASFRLEPSGVAKVDPMRDMKNPKDLIKAPYSYKVYFVPRNEARLQKLLAEAKEEQW